MLPTPDSASHYLLNLSDNPKKNREIWGKLFEPLDGMTHLGTVETGSTILARAAKGDSLKATGEPMLVSTKRGNGRVLVFAGDTTWRAWRRTPETVAAYERFWKQTMLWLAKQENSEGAAWIKLDSRRLSAGVDQRLGFNVGLRGKGGVELKKAQFKATVGRGGEGEKGRKGERLPLSPSPLSPSPLLPLFCRSAHPWPRTTASAAIFSRPTRRANISVKVEAQGKDIDGKDIKAFTSARFLIAAEDLETQRPAANHDFLRKLAHAGGGQFFPADEQNLLGLLHKLPAQKQTRTSVDVWPDWRRAPPAYGEDSPGDD